MLSLSEKGGFLKFTFLETCTLLSVFVIIFFVLNYFQIVNFGAYFKKNLPVQKNYSAIYTKSHEEDLDVHEFLNFSNLLKTGNVGQATLDLRYKGKIGKIVLAKQGISTHEVSVVVNSTVMKLDIPLDSQSTVLDIISNKREPITMEDLRVGDTIDIAYKIDLLDNKAITEYRILRVSGPR